MYIAHGEPRGSLALRWAWALLQGKPPLLYLAPYIPPGQLWVYDPACSLCCETTAEGPWCLSCIPEGFGQAGQDLLSTCGLPILQAGGISCWLPGRAGRGAERGIRKQRRRRYLHLREGAARWIYLEHFSLARLLVGVLLTALLSVMLALPLGPDLRGPALELPATLSTLS